MTDGIFDDLISFQGMMLDIIQLDPNDILFGIPEEYFNDYEHFCQLFKTLIVIIRTRPFVLVNVFNFISKIKEHISKYYTKTQLLFHFSFNMSAIYHLYKLNLITLDDALRRNSITKMKSYVYFDPEIEQFKPKLYQENQSSIYFQSLKNSYSQLDIKKYRETGLNSSNYAKIIQADDVDSLQKLISQTNLDINTLIPRSEFETNEIFDPKMSISFIEYAAFLGSINVFKFLLMNNAELRPIIARLATAGGNYEIIHLLESKFIRFRDEAFSTSIIFHQNQLFEYFHSTYDISFNSKHLALAIQYYNFFCLNAILYETPNLFQNLNEVISMMILACQFGNLDALKYLFTIIDCHKLMKKNPRIFLQACSFGHVNIVEYLLSIDGICKAVTDRACNTALHIASYEGHVDIVRLLVNTGLFSPNELNKFHETSLQRAIRSQGYYVVKYFIEECKEKININNVTQNWTTALMTSIENDLYDIFELLLSCEGIDLSIRCKTGKTALHLAALFGNHEMVARLLAIQGIGLNFRDKDGLTPLFSAVQSNKKDIIELFVKKEGVDLKATDNCILFIFFLWNLPLFLINYTILHFAAVKYCNQSFKYILDNKIIDPSTKDKFGVLSLFGFNRTAFQLRE